MRIQDRDDASRKTVVVAHPGAELFGSDRMMLESVRGLIRAGHRVVVALPVQGPLVRDLLDAGAQVVIIPMLVLRKSLLRPRAWGHLVSDGARGFVAAWRLLRRQSAVAVYVSTITIPQWIGVARLLRIPSVTHVHEAEASAPRALRMALYAPHLSARKVVVNSEFSRLTIARTFPSLATRADVVYNGVPSPESVAPPRATLDTVRLLYVGRLSPRKGVEDIVAAARLLSERGVPVSVTILGSVFPGYEWFEDGLKKLASRPGSPPTTFLGFAPDVWPILAEHDILVVPSRIDEPFGNTAVEGILARRPVIASDTSGLREAAGGYPTTRLVPPSRPDRIADEVSCIVHDWPTIRDALGSSQALAQQRHSPDIYRAAIASAVSQAASHDTK